MRNRFLVVALLTGGVYTSAIAQTDFSQMEIKTTEVAPGVYMLEGAGGNIGVSAGEDGIFLIDDQFAPLTEKIVAAVKMVDDGPIRFVLNTHWHGDHTGGNENLGRKGALIVAHENARRQMTVGQFLELWDRKVEPSSEASLPVVTFSDEITFHLNGDVVRAFHVERAHTDGDSMVHFEKADVLHMGDVFFNGGFPLIDVYSGGSLAGVLAACQLALELVDEDTRIIPGHGALGTRADLIAYRNMLHQAHDAVAPLVRQGKSLVEIRTIDPLAPLAEEWGGLFMNPEEFLELVVTGMQP